jgi:excinuclease ABC subunit C
MSAGLKEKAAELPELPGCYLFRSSRGTVLYVGKAKILRRRVLSYFGDPAGRPPRVRAMLAEAADLEVILTGSEVEALILENTLVKKNRPRFNVLLRDDKNFPYLKLTIRDRFPRVVLVRRPKLDGQLYFGPYTPASVARRSLKMVARFFQVATCYEKFDGSRKRPCILYQMHQCLAPCVDLVQPDPYAEAVRDVRLFLEGRNTELTGSLTAKMKEAAARQEFERAAHYRDLLAAVSALSRRQAVASVGLDDQDYFGIHRQDGRATLQVFQMRGGLMQSRREFFFEETEEAEEELMGEALVRYYGGVPTVPRRVFVSAEPGGSGVIESWLGERRGEKVRIVCPQRGVHRSFMATVLENARLAWKERFAADHNLGVAVHEALKEILSLEEVPSRIEGFDISHVQGTDTVASVVVWEGGRPRRSEYRRMRIVAAAPGDDFAAIEEAVSRRYRRLVREGKRLPDLILIDGGRGQLSAARGALAAQGIETVPVIALAKREEEILVPGNPEPVRLPGRSPVRHLVTRVRDEAHRFAVTYHRGRRRQRTLSTELLEVPGIGPARARKLLRSFGSVRAVKEASGEALAEVVGPTAAGAVRGFFAGSRVKKARS